ncbi:carboxymuconolactone decarboxylase family protein [Candidatus Bathyarchaeota archaeon]|nr:carboxymuconolactone decarboxylase family protein [Candidatus Bathyarchaeota archaeon]
MSERSKRLLEEMMRKRGYVYPSYRVLAEDDPEFLETYDRLYELAMIRTRIFPEKIKELFFICAIAARNPGDASAMKNHMRRALERGATKEEILEALKCALFPGGALSLLYSINSLIEVLKERGPSMAQA